MEEMIISLVNIKISETSAGHSPIAGSLLARMARPVEAIRIGGWK